MVQKRKIIDSPIDANLTDMVTPEVGSLLIDSIIEVKRKLTDIRLFDNPPRMIRPDEEMLLFEIQAALDLLDKYEAQTGLNPVEQRLNGEYAQHARRIETILKDNKFVEKLYYLAQSLQRMEVIKRVKEEKISISKYTDKYGNAYLKAKTAYPLFRFEDGKKKITHKSISFHLGRLEDFEGGINDEKAIVTARQKLLQKAKQMMDVQIYTRKPK